MLLHLFEHLLLKLLCHAWCAQNILNGLELTFSEFLPFFASGDNLLVQFSFNISELQQSSVLLLDLIHVLSVFELPVLNL